MALETLRNSAFSAFLVGQQAARLMRENIPNANGTKGTIIFTNASAALKGFPTSGAFAMACQAKSGLAQSMARELMPQGIHIANVPIDAAIGWTQEDGTPRAPTGGNDRDDNGAKGTIIFTNASAALKGFPTSGAFAMACQAKSGLAQSMARELMPQGIHVANVPIDAAIGWTQPDGTRAHRLAGTTVDDNMADPDHIAETYLHLHRQHRSTWAFEVVLRPWVERW